MGLGLGLAREVPTCCSLLSTFRKTKGVTPWETVCGHAKPCGGGLFG